MNSNPRRFFRLDPLTTLVIVALLSNAVIIAFTKSYNMESTRLTKEAYEQKREEIVARMMPIQSEVMLAEGVTEWSETRFARSRPQ